MTSPNFPDVAFAEASCITGGAPQTISVEIKTTDFSIADSEEGRKEMFYLTTHSSYLFYGYMASDIG